MAHKKASGSGKNGRDSHPKRLGVKCFDGEFVTAGSIIMRQRGTKITAGNNVKCARDFSLFALKPGQVKFEKGGKRVAVVELAPAQ